MSVNRGGTMKRMIGVVLLVMCCSGCAMLAKAQYPTVLVSNEQQWTIEKGQEFTAIQKPKFDKPTKFIADEDLAVLYKGNLLALEQEANSKAIKAARAARTQGAAWGAIGSLLTAAAGFAAKKGIGKMFDKKEKKVV